MDVSDLRLENHRRISLAETLDRVLNKGAVVTGDITLSVADIDLVYVALQLLVCSVQTAQSLPGRTSGASPPRTRPAQTAADAEPPERARRGLAGPTP